MIKRGHTKTYKHNTATGWFEIFKVITFDLDEVTGRNDEYIDK